MTTYWTFVDSPVGELLLTSDGTSLTRCHYDAEPDPSWTEGGCAVLEEAAAQLKDYFAGERTTFDLPLDAAGSSFQRRVWAALRAIPYAETISYGELARRLGDTNASRAVGLANGRNPIAIIVPCHRVIGAKGTLTGYAGGLDRKRTLLDLERRSAGVDDAQLSLL